MKTQKYHVMMNYKKAIVARDVGLEEGAKSFYERDNFSHSSTNRDFQQTILI